MRKKKKIFLIVFSFIVISILILITGYLNNKKIKNFYEKRISLLNDEIDKNKKSVYIAKEKIKSGDIIDESKVEYVEIYSSLDEKQYFSKKDFGKIAIVDIEKDMCIFKMMFTKELISNDLREKEFTCLRLNTNVNENDVVDVRISFPNGEDYIILSKKELKSLILEINSCYLWLNEEEILRLNSAIVDASLHKGTKIYTTKYIEPNIQESCVENYQPNEDVMKLIENNPNIVELANEILSKEAREDLELRLKVFEKENKDINYYDGIDYENTYKVEDIENERSEETGIVYVD